MIAPASRLALDPEMPSPGPRCSKAARLYNQLRSKGSNLRGSNAKTGHRLKGKRNDPSEGPQTGERYGFGVDSWVRIDSKGYANTTYISESHPPHPKTSILDPCVLNLKPRCSKAARLYNQLRSMGSNLRGSNGKTGHRLKGKRNEVCENQQSMIFHSFE